MTKEQIETALLEQRAKWLEKLDLVNKVTTAVADVRHHQAPSKARPKIHWPLSKCFGEISAKDNPSEFPR